MASYYLNEAVIDLPERPFADKTIHGLESKLPSGKTLGVLVHRRPIASEKPVSDGTLRELVDENVALNQKRLSGFTVLDQIQTAVGGIPGILLRTRWRNAGTIFYQLQAHVVFERKLVIIAVSGPLDEQAACDETFDSILATIAWRTTD